jgi:GNAT superfamily N-acetyltransferase
MNYISEPLQTKYNKTDFLCGESLLDNYIQKQANQDIKRKLAACFVIPDSVSNRIAAYYTLSNNSIPLHEVPLELRKKLPKSYHSIPTTLLGRLAIDKNYQGRGMGKLLLIDALKRSYLTSKNIGSFAVIVDPLHDKAKRFYLKYGFIPLPDSGKMFLPMKTIGQLFT